MLGKVLLGLGAAAVFVAATSGSAKADPTKLAIGTPAAKQSPWGTVFKTWKAAVEAKTKNAVTFEFFYGSIKGTEDAMVTKMKAGELDGAAITSLGLSKFDKRLNLIQVPGVIASWKTVDAIRDAHGAMFEKMLTDSKMTLITWGDVGNAHFLSSGFGVSAPGDLCGRKPWVYSEDPIQAAVYKQLNATCPGDKQVAPFKQELMKVLPDINSGKIDSMVVSALAAEMLQWNSKFDHGTDEVEGIVVGAVVMTSDSLNKLPGDAKEAVLETGKAMGTSKSGLKQKIRDEDAAAWKRFVDAHAGNISKVSEKGPWDKVFTAARNELKGKAEFKDVIEKIEKTAAANK